MKKYILFFFIFILIIGLFTVTAVANTKNVIDDATLFTDEGQQALQESIDEIKSELNLDAVILTSQDTNGKTSLDFADDFYDYNGFGCGDDKSGLILFINMQERDIIISTTGRAIDIFTDSRRQSIMNSIIPLLQNENYLEAGNIFLSEIKRYLDLGIPSGQKRIPENNNGYHQSPESSSKDISSLAGISAVSALIIALIPCLIIRSKYKNPKSQNAQSYIVQETVNYKSVFDNFIGTNTVSQYVGNSNNSGSGSGSTTHTSSSGTTHSSSRGKF